MSELYIVDNSREQLDAQLRETKRDKFVDLTVRLLGIRAFVLIDSDIPYPGAIASHYLPQPIVLENFPSQKTFIIDRLSTPIPPDSEYELNYSTRVAEGQCFTGKEPISKKAFLIIPEDPADPAELEIFNSDEVLPEKLP
ncbi:MAG TPA: hypothetical protein VMR51_00260 [Patescibacteria group bacterium]|nr:hypothetical protein [Patescibacteria group bacterium]